MKTLTVVRGFPGSGRTTLAESLGKEGVVISLDEFLEPAGEASDIYTTHSVANAQGLLHAKVASAISIGYPRIVVDTLAPGLWEIRDLFALAKAEGYETKVEEPTTPWARDPVQCQDRTQFPLLEKTWTHMVRTWEGPATEAKIAESLSPDQRLQNARWLAALPDITTDPVKKHELNRFLLDNFPEEVNEMSHRGFLSEKNSLSIRQSFLRQMEREGRKQPTLQPIEIPSIGLDRLERDLGRGQPKSNKPKSLGPDFN